ARDRFMFELRMPTPAEVEVRRSLVFNPDFHDVDELLQRVAPGVLPWQELNRIGAAIQRSVKASEALERYVLDLWDASQSPQRFGVRIDGVDMDKLILAGASPRGMMTLPRASSPGSRAVPISCRRTCRASCPRSWGIAFSSLRSMSCGARRSPTRWWRRSWNAFRHPASHGRAAGVPLPASLPRRRLAARRAPWNAPRRGTGIRLAYEPVRSPGPASA